MKKFLKLAMTGPLKRLLTGSMIVTSTSAGTFVTPPNDAHMVWHNIRREMEQDRAPAHVAEDMRDLFALYRAEQIDLPMMVRLSYLQTVPSDRARMDEFWAEYLASRGAEIGFETFLALRAEAIGSSDLGSEDMLGNWLWKASANDNYDCVAGGGSGNCGVGGGLGGGNGTGNEGGGN